MASHAPLTPPVEHELCSHELANEENNLTPTPSSYKHASSKQVSRGTSPTAPELADEVYRSPQSTSKEPESTENRLRPAADVINRIIWDAKFDSDDYIIGYEDRFNGRLETSLGSWKKDLTDEEFIPQHRIIYIKRKLGEEIVWDKRRRTDKIFYSGNSAYSWLTFLT
ncbi:DUF504 domain-containing protein [Aspergillus ruber CBS 135680]|uniref:MJ1316 RNA cyclic group end recognition domain-containing protein n=1 Tax=Aspergillus ruber (strain CBS 135680) TaxID=1388766 RepID=A0A017SQH4_ASPRC|nr:uncharacterized protein EURHEDRAFT_408075 [Aspergillus ruber CBS 135680]EYE98864.1 hypothetical protein EURHEDRAFT_408075 [Aspergillus ruber CBS 135680]